MKINILKFFTILLFVSLMSTFVLYQSGYFKSVDTSKKRSVDKDSLKVILPSSKVFIIKDLKKKKPKKDSLTVDIMSSSKSMILFNKLAISNIKMDTLKKVNNDR